MNAKLNKIPKRLLKNKVLISADITLEEQMTLNGKKLFISKPLATGDKDQNFSPYARAVQIATITKLPDHLDHFKSIDETIYHYPDPKLKVGEQVIVHHFQIQPEKEIVYTGKSKHYECPYNMIYGVIRKGKIVPLHDYVFCSPIFEPEENRMTKGGIVTKFTPGVLESLTKQMEQKNSGAFMQQTINRAIAPIRIPNQARIDYTCAGGPNSDLFPGDVIVHKPRHNYIIPVNGKDYTVLSIHQSVLAKLS